MLKIFIICIVIFSNLSFAQNCEEVKTIERKIIKIQEANNYLKDLSYVEDFDENFDVDEKHYIVKNVGYLVIYDFLDEAVLFKSKESYIDFLKQDDFSMFDIDVEHIINNSDSLIINLSSLIGFPLRNNDRIEGLKIIDNIIFKNGIENFDFIDNFDCYFAYFSKIIFNEVGSDFREMTIDDQKQSLKIIKPNDEEVEVFLPFYKMLINQDEIFSFYSLAKQIIYPLKLRLEENDKND